MRIIFLTILMTLFLNVLHSNCLYVVEALLSQNDPFAATSKTNSENKFKIVSEVKIDSKIGSRLVDIISKSGSDDEGSPFSFLGPVMDFYYYNSELKRSVIISIALTHVDKNMLYCQFADFKKSGEFVIEKNSRARKSLVVKDSELFSVLSDNYYSLFSNEKFNNVFFPEDNLMSVVPKYVRYIFPSKLKSVQNNSISRALLVSFDYKSIKKKELQNLYNLTDNKDQFLSLLQDIAQLCGIQIKDSKDLNVFIRSMNVPNTAIVYLDEKNKSGYALELICM